jgi:EpsI family protein
MTALSVEEEVRPQATLVSRRSLLVGGGLALTAVAAAAATPRRHEQMLGRTRLQDVITAQVGPWSSRVNGSLILPDDADQPHDFYDQVFSRSYVAQGLPVIMLVIAYGAAQSGMMKVHRPEVCYASAGFSIHDLRPADVPQGAAPAITGQSFLAQRQDRVEQVLYWTRISDSFPRNLTAQRLVMLERGLHGVIPDGVLVRISTLGNSLASGHGAMEAFAQNLIVSASPLGKSILLGRSRAGLA